MSEFGSYGDVLERVTADGWRVRARIVADDYGSPDGYGLEGKVREVPRWEYRDTLEAAADTMRAGGPVFLPRSGVLWEPAQSLQDRAEEYRTVNTKRGTPYTARGARLRALADLQADAARLDAYYSGDWSYLGVVVDVSGPEAGAAVGTASLWGIESDSDAAYFAEARADLEADALAGLTRPDALQMSAAAQADPEYLAALGPEARAIVDAVRAALAPLAARLEARGAAQADGGAL